MEDIRNALAKLGIKGQKFQTAHYTSFTTKVYVDGKFIGLWDRVKRNFVA